MKPVIDGKVEILSQCYVYDFAEIIAKNDSSITLCGNNYIFSHARIIAEGSSNQIVIGANTRVQIRTMIMGDVAIGRDSIIAPDVFISSGTHFYDLAPAVPINEQDQLANSILPCNSLPITIGNDVWIGRLTTVMPGINIGNGSIIGANSVVTHDIPSGQVWAGNPCRFIKTRGPLPNYSRLERYRSQQSSPYLITQLAPQRPD